MRTAFCPAPPLSFAGKNVPLYVHEDMYIIRIRLVQNPLTASLDKLVEHRANVRECEAADVKGKKFCGVTGAEFETDMSLGA